MTEQEMREKIFNIIREFNVKKRRYSMYTKPSDDEELTNALVGAGIGDVNGYKHRAEVAERALENACVVILSSRNGDEPRRLRAYYKAYLEAAEKELAEEGKDD